VLAYPKFRLSGPEREELLAEFLPFAETGAEPLPTWPGPEPRDPDDTKFLALAHAARADAIVTGGCDLLVLAGRLPIPIVTPAELALRLGV
jgi:putative PIN family toxin of toxin-antitoxin system